MGPNFPAVSRPAGALTPAEGKAISLELNRRAAENPLYGDTRMELAPGRHTAWRISPEPYPLPLPVFHQLQQLGNHLLAFYQAANKLYLESVKGRQPAWVHRFLDQGKPDSLIDYQRMNRFKKLTPMVIRPDVFQTEDGRLVASELDSVPGGIGLTGSMAHDYTDFGYGVVGGGNGLVTNFAAMIRSVGEKESPVLAIVVSEEANDYWIEQNWLGRQLNELGLETYVVRPQDVSYVDDGLFVRKGEEARRIDVLYRFFELFDLKNIPKSELVMYANKKEQVIVTPPYKTILEEKMLFALYHHPVLKPFWVGELGKDVYHTLESLFPRTWIVDPTPLPSQAVIPGLEVGGLPLTDWRDLAKATKKEREFVLKPSGFSSLAWGSHGVSFLHDLSAVDCEAAIEKALASFPTTPYILQEFHKPAKTQSSYYNFRKEEIVAMEGRARLCPYYYVVDGQAVLSGILGTICPPDKLAIHGMTDAVMVPCMVATS